ncbi:MAG: extracellular solute-binding protein, partial [Pygmaiobacter massiliensis]|nr:extracellular solute-binding protein [Pygmaiobacter massiliensis]
MKRMNKVLALALAAVMTASALAGCGGAASSSTPAASSGSTSTGAKGQVYYLNFKPEQADQWTALAKKYTEQTGVPVNVVTAASGTYEQTLKSEIAKTEAPTLFQVNGPVGLASWKDY